LRHRRVGAGGGHDRAFAPSKVRPYPAVATPAPLGGERDYYTSAARPPVADGAASSDG